MCPTTVSPECSNIAETEEKDLTTNCIRMIEILTKEMNKSLIGIMENIGNQL